MKRETRAWLRQLVREDMDKREHPATDVLRSEREQEATIRKLLAREVRYRKAIKELITANSFGMSVTGGWDDAGKDPLYIQCANAHRLGEAALKVRR